jgi:acyl-coenzyme A thioesterase PaaI-like protein
MSPDSSAKKQPAFIRPGHNAAEFLQSSKWELLREDPGDVELRVHLPDCVFNPHGELYGGFTGTYVDMVAIYAVKTMFTKKDRLIRTPTVNMRIDYLEPVKPPGFILKSKVLKNGRSTCLVNTEFYDFENNLKAYALTTVRKIFAP